jgi:electron transport complex protein RnfD
MTEANKTNAPLLLLSSSPHISTPASAQSLMVNVLVALAPAAVFGIVLYGIPALVTIVTAVVSAMAAEALFRRVTKQAPRLKDCSAAVTGLLLALTLPPASPAWMTALGAVFAIVVVKEFFGGLGANVFNPALGGRAFLLASFPALMTTWNKPAGFADAVTTATPLGIIKEAAGAAAVINGDVVIGPLQQGLMNAGLPINGGDLVSTLFFGDYGGSIGETSALLILAGGIYLACTRTIDLRAPLAMLGTAVIAAALLGINPLVALLSGGLLFGAVFMATDYVSAPVTERGKLIFGAGAGLITILIRKFGSYPEGVMYSLLIMNAVTPYLNRVTHRKYGFVQKKKGAAT